MEQDDDYCLVYCPILSSGSLVGLNGWCLSLRLSVLGLVGCYNSGDLYRFQPSATPPIPAQCWDDKIGYAGL